MRIEAVPEGLDQLAVAKSAVLVYLYTVSVRRRATHHNSKGGIVMAVKKPIKKAVPKKPAKKAVKRTPNAAFMKPMQPSDALAKIVGSKPIPRTEITKKVWAYIKKNDLQDAKIRRNINADANLLPVFGGKKQVTMFEMTKLINKHLK